MGRHEGRLVPKAIKKMMVSEYVCSEKSIAAGCELSYVDRQLWRCASNVLVHTPHEAQAFLGFWWVQTFLSTDFNQICMGFHVEQTDVTPLAKTWHDNEWMP